MKKIKAFTTLEAAIVMVLSSIIIGSAGFGAYIIQEQFRTFQMSINGLSDVVTFHKILQKDLAQSEMIYHIDNKIECIGYEGSMIAYLLQDTAIVRIKDSNRAVFQVNVTDIDFGYIGTDIHDKQVTHSILMAVECSGYEEKLYFFKEYGLDTKMQFIVAGK